MVSWPTPRLGARISVPTPPANRSARSPWPPSHNSPHAAGANLPSSTTFACSPRLVLEREKQGIPPDKGDARVQHCSIPPSLPPLARQLHGPFIVYVVVHVHTPLGGITVSLILHFAQGEPR